MTDDFDARYYSFLDKSKTERLVIRNVRDEAEKKGFVPVTGKEELVPGDKVYFMNRSKSLVLVTVGKNQISDGLNLVAVHSDSPRLDLKPNPLYEESGISLLRTQYYGGIKKYQWAAIPLQLTGTVVLKSGKRVEVSIGDGPDDPVFTIPDLLPHLAKYAQNERTAKDALKGEELQVLFGIALKTELLEKLENTYGMEEEDFLSAELELVPALATRDVGFDRSLVGGYGQDDRVCVFTAVQALFSLADEIPETTAVVYIADKEEAGSVGATSLDSQYLEFVTEELIRKTTGQAASDLLNRTLWNSHALSADVTVAFDPVFKAVHDEQNAAKLGSGIVLSKFIGSGGKMHCQDADAEYVASIRRLLTIAGVKYQGAAFGKVDEGGGGTVARYLAARGIEVLNAGPALLGMHSPFEIASKTDIRETCNAYSAFFRAGKDAFFAG
jgi:aspartyl aminopeptidase